MEVLTEIGDKIGFDWKLSITHLINFLIIFFLLVKYALPALKRTIDERTAKIKEGLRMRDEADKIVISAEEQSKVITREANQKAEGIISKSEVNAKEIVLTASDKASEVIKKAQAEQDHAKEKGLKEAEGILSKDISSILTKIANSAFDGKITTENNSDFVSKVFKENYTK